MNAESKLFRMVLVSPWFLLIFLLVPLSVILNVTLHTRFPLAGIKPLLINNICFAVLIAGRFVRYLIGMRKVVRYGAFNGQPRKPVTISMGAAEARVALEHSGYVFVGAGDYGEKPDLGYLGTTVLYGGLLIVLCTGTLDNLRQFSGTLLDAMGPPTKLSRMESYRSLVVGPLAARIDTLPQMKIMDQLMPSRDYPHGATDIALLSAEGELKRKIVKPGEPFRFGDYDIFMDKFIFQPQIVIKTRDLKPVFNGLVLLNPIVRKDGAYGFHGQFKKANLEGLVYYQSDKNRLKVVLKRDGNWVFDDEMKFQTDQQVAQGDYVLSCERLGKWTEIHVIRRRHMPILVGGGILAAIGLFMRLLFRPQRVWLEDVPERSRVIAVGRATKRLLGIEG